MVLGEEEKLEPSFLNLSTSRCFNCGLPDHIVSSCPLPVDRAVVSLSRQYYNFLQASKGVVDFKRIHVVEEWRQQRLEWLDTFEPGQIRGPALQAALGNEGGDWLKNMTIWGYPKGWVSVEDPREQVRQLIWNENCDGGSPMEMTDPFMIFGDNSMEAVHPVLVDSNPPEKNESEGSDRDSSSSDSNCSQATGPIRWAQYPPTHFASHLLPVYTGVQLPSMSHRGSSTYSADRQKLWQHIITSMDPTQPPSNGIPPWRLSDAFGINTNPPSLPSTEASFIPPPPATEPPPLPPPDVKSHPPSELTSPDDDMEELDMDTSD